MRIIKMQKIKEYSNYIFDLYGTLIDIKTDERKAELWNCLADFYNVYGCDRSANDMRDIFFLMDKEERIALKEATGYTYPEIRLERVYSRLLFECQKTHPVSACIDGVPVDELREEYVNNKEKVIDFVQTSDWCMNVANLFRIMSREHIGLFPDTLKVLDELRANGKKVFLLSNAQKIFTMPEIEAMDLKSRFDGMYISSDEYAMKPDTTFMDKLIDRENLDRSRSVMIGDDPTNDMTLAIKSGMDGILLNTSHRTDAEIKEVIDEAVRGLKEPYTGNITILNEIKELTSGEN